MAGLFGERKPFLLLLALLSLHLILMSSYVPGSGRGSLLEEVILTAVSPFLKSAAWVSRGTVGIWRTYVDLRGVERDNQRLRAEVEALAPKTQQAEEARLEADRLRELLDLRGEIAFPSLAARVIALRTAGGSWTILLDRGSRDGVSKDQPVVSPRGVIGRIIEAAPGISKVQTILDPNSSVAALLQRTRTQGMVVGEGDRGCRMEYVSELADVEVGDIVVTSGLDQIQPKGTLLGTVTEISEGEGLTKNVKIRPEVNFRRLEEVSVVLRSEPLPKEDK
jgi:rod shape-determining protein MreC